MYDSVLLVTVEWTHVTVEGLLLLRRVLVSKEVVIGETWEEVLSLGGGCYCGKRFELHILG